MIFFSLDLPQYKLDVFHEGQLLSGALNYSLKDKLWIGSYLNTGLFYDILNTKIAWFIFNNDSIGSYRLFQLILNYIFYFIIILFGFSVSRIFNLNKNKENFFFIILSSFFLFFYIISYSNFPNYRDIFSIIFLICLVNALLKDDKQFLNYFVIGTLSILSLLWSLDRGLFLNATLIPLIFILILKKKVFEILLLIFGIIVSWVLFFLFVGFDEFNAFLNNSLNILNYNELWNGLIHPQPFSDEKNSTRATKALIIILLNGIIITKYFFDRTNSLSVNTKILLLIFYILGFFYYKIGLSRSDGGHIVIGSSINYILFVIILLNSLLKIDYSKYNLNFVFKKKFVISYIFLIIFVFYNNNETKSNTFKNFFTFGSRINNFISMKDDLFLENDYLNFINQMKLITYDSKCIQNFNYDPSIFYLLKKESCTKYYYTFIMASQKDQKNFIYELETTKPEILLTNLSPLIYEFPPELRFPIINNFLKENYDNFKVIKNYKILLINN